MVVDLILVSYKSERWLPRCLESVYSSEFYGRCWLIDNDIISKQLRDLLLTSYPQINYHRTGANIGFGRANNLGIKYALDAGADIIGLINPDIWLEANWAEEIRKTFYQENILGLVAPLQLCYNSYSPTGWTRAALGIDSLDNLKPEFSTFTVDWIEASALFIRREVFEKIGGFDPLFNLYYEDNDFCRRARLAGFKLAVITNAKYHHYGGSTVGGRESTEHNIRCDLGQILYILTDPKNKFAVNIFEVVRLLMRRMMCMLKYSYQKEIYIYRLINQLIFMLWKKRKEIYRKWKRDKSIKINLTDRKFFI